MPAPTLRDIIGDQDVASGVEEVCLQLEAEGWFPRKRRGKHGVAYWPDNERKRQYIVDVSYPMNDHRREVIAQNTGLAISVENREGGQQ